MSREPIDFGYVSPDHAAVHERLLNWARWCRSTNPGGDTSPMFRGYRDGYHQPRPSARYQIDTLDAQLVQRVFASLQHPYRVALGWAYCKPYISVLRARTSMELTTPQLWGLLQQSRTAMGAALDADQRSTAQSRPTDATSAFTLA